MKTIMSKTFAFFAFQLLAIGVKGSGMIEVFKWKEMDFYNCDRIPRTQCVYPAYVFSGLAENDGIPSDIGLSLESIDVTKKVPMCGGQEADEPFIPYNNVPMGVTRYKNILFVTVPRRREGVPSTLNYINLDLANGKKSPKLRPFPDMFANQYKSNPIGLVSVYRPCLDACQRLWFVDTGMLEYPDNFQQIRSPSIWIYDLKSDKVERRFEIPNSIAEVGRGIVSITIDVQADNCDAAFAYIPDLYSRRLHVYSLAENKAWSFEHHSFNPDPLAGNLTVGGRSFLWSDGIFSITLGPLFQKDNRNVFYHAMQSNNEFVVSSRFLKNKTNVLNAKYGHDFRFVGSRGFRKQSNMHKYDNQTGVLFYNEINNNGIGCWNSRTKFTPKNHGIVAQDPKRMIYPSDLTIDENGDVWVITNSLPLFLYSKLNPYRYNFRIWKQSVVEAKKGTICE